MNVQKLNSGGLGQDLGRRKFDHNAQSMSEVAEKKKISEYLDITETEFIDLVNERDLLASEIIFTRNGAQYSSVCYDMLQKCEKTAEQFQTALQKRFDASLKANSVIQDSIFAEIEVKSSHSAQRRATQRDRRADDQHRRIDPRCSETGQRAGKEN